MVLSTLANDAIALRHNKEILTIPSMREARMIDAVDDVRTRLHKGCCIRHLLNRRIVADYQRIPRYMSKPSSPPVIRNVVVISKVSNTADISIRNVPFQNLIKAWVRQVGVTTKTIGNVTRRRLSSSHATSALGSFVPTPACTCTTAPDPKSVFRLQSQPRRTEATRLPHSRLLPGVHRGVEPLVPQHGLVPVPKVNMRIRERHPR